MGIVSDQIMDGLWKHVFRGLVYGPSGSGKTNWTIHFIKNVESLTNVSFKKIVWCYSEWQSVYEELLPKVDFIEGCPTNLDMLDPKEPSLIILDDLMSCVNSFVTDLFVKYSHHRNCSVLYLVQNLFPKDPHSRTISLNANMFVLFKNPRDKSQVKTLARQVFPGESQVMLEAFQDATAKKYGYLVVDLHMDTDENLRLRTDIFPDDESGQVSFVYVKNGA